MALDDQLRGRIEAVLREYAAVRAAEPDFESRLVFHVDKLAHLAKVAMCVELDPPRISRKVGQRGPSRTPRKGRLYTTALYGAAPDHCAHVADYSKR